MTAWYDTVPHDAHWLITGGTRKGKSGLLSLVTRAYIKRGIDGITAIDPHGAFVHGVAEWMANPAHRQLDRPVHILDPASSLSFGLNPLDTFGDTSFEACHDAAITLSSVVEAHFDASPEETPRLARIVYCAGVLCARHRLTVLELLEFLSLGGTELRRSLLQDFEHRIVRRELEDLAHLADKHPTRFYDLVESTKSRFLKWASDPRMARILGQKTSLNPRAVMDTRSIVLVDLSSLTYDDAAFIGALFTSTYVAAARHRPPLRCAGHRLILDEAESLITIAVARMLDQTGKTGLFVTASLQRLGQVRARGDFIADALFGNAAVKVAFGGLEPESANYIARLFFTGFLDLAAYKPGTERPTVIGQEKTTVRSSSRATHEARHETHAVTRSHSHGEADGTTSSTSTASGEFAGLGESAGMVMSPPMTLLGPNAPGASMPQMIVSESAADNNSRGSSEQSATSSGESHVSIDTWGEAETHGTGTSHGTSVSEGESEVFISQFQWLPTQLYSLEEQWHRVEADLMNLPRRECYVRVEEGRPFRTRTADLTPPFKSLVLKTEMLPRFLRNTSARSPYLLPAPVVDAAIAARFADLLKPRSTPDRVITEPEPLPIIDAPEQFAHNFWKGRSPPDGPPKPKPKRPPGRRPQGDLRPEHDRFGVIEGDGDKKD